MSRQQLLRARRSIENQIRGALKTLGVMTGPTKGRGFMPRVTELRADNDWLGSVLDPLLAAHASIAKQIKVVSTSVLEAARGDADVRRMMTVAGVGAMTALAFKAAIDDPKRFTSSSKVGPYLGLTPRQYQSGESASSRSPVRYCLHRGQWSPKLLARGSSHGQSKAIGSLMASTIDFASSDLLTLGVEVEVQLIEPASLGLAARAPELLRACSSMKRIAPEFFQSTIEVKTDICRSAHDAGSTLAPDLQALATCATALELGLCTTGCHPFARYADCHVTDTPRYRELIDRHQWLTRRMTVYGLHIHVGMTSGEECIKFQNSFLNYLPHLLAISASSPFWQGQDTGLASCRPTTYDALPTAGQPYPIHDWGEFEELCHVLRRCNAIRSMKDLWWDIRPSPGFGTLEIRCCDGPATLAEALALTAFVHMLGLRVGDRVSSDCKVLPPPRWMLRENKWRAIRHGLDADHIIDAEGGTRLLRDDIALLLDEMRPLIATLGYETHVRTLQRILASGNSTTRQRAVYAKRQLVKDIVQFNIEEFRAGQPIW